MDETKSIDELKQEIETLVQETKYDLERTMLFINYSMLKIRRKKICTVIIIKKLKMIMDENTREIAGKRYDIDGWLNAHRDNPVAKDITEAADKQFANIEEVSGINENVASIQGIINVETEELLFAICGDILFIFDGEKYRVVHGNELKDFDIDESKALLKTTSQEEIEINLIKWSPDEKDILKDVLSVAKEYTESYAEYFDNIENLEKYGFKNREDAEAWLEKEDKKMGVEMLQE